MRRARVLGAALLLAAMSGCGRPAATVQPPLLTLARPDCDAVPDFGRALPVRTEDRFGTAAVLDGGGRCLARPGAQATPYAVFALPIDPAPYTLEIFSDVIGQAVVRPVATLFDAAGQPVRVLPPEEFETTVRGLRAGVRPRGTERWLMVAADQARLGQQLEMRMGGIDGRVRTAATVFVPVIIVPPFTPDPIRHRSAVFALNGRITVTAAPVQLAR